MKLEAIKKEFIDAIYFHQQYNSSGCWTTTKEALNLFIKLTAKKDKFVKELILIRYLGLGWLEKHHPWSKDGVAFTPVELMEHFCKVVLPLDGTMVVPDKPPLKLPALLTLRKIGTRAKIM